MLLLFPLLLLFTSSSGCNSCISLCFCFLNKCHIIIHSFINLVFLFLLLLLLLFLHLHLHLHLHSLLLIILFLPFTILCISLLLCLLISLQSSNFPMNPSNYMSRHFSQHPWNITISQTRFIIILVSENISITTNKFPTTITP